MNTLIKEYISTAKPVGSKHLQKSYDLDVCPATVRGEMQKLTKEGYLKQPHTSSGRVPTNKGYRFFVDSFSDSNFQDDAPCLQFKQPKGAEQDVFRFAELTTRFLASSSCGLVMSCLLKRGLVWEDGWEEIFHIPEFEEKSFRNIFVREAKSLTEKFEDISLSGKVDVFIGREKSVLGSKDVSLIITKSWFPDKEEGVIAVLGPNRMAYDKNINIMNYLISLFEDF